MIQKMFPYFSNNSEKEVFDIPLFVLSNIKCEGNYFELNRLGWQCGFLLRNRSLFHGHQGLDWFLRRLLL